MQTTNADKHVLCVIIKTLVATGVDDDEAVVRATAAIEDALPLFHAEFARALGGSNDPRQALAAMRAATTAVEAWARENG